jgi:hypothetical protein
VRGLAPGGEVSAAKEAQGFATECGQQEMKPGDGTLDEHCGSPEDPTARRV